MTAFSVDFVDFWPNFLKHDNYFFHLLSQKYEITVDEINPDIVFMSCYSMDKQRYIGHRCKKIFFTGENRGLQCVIEGKWSDIQYNYDLTLTFDETYQKNIYLPLFVLYINWFNTPHNPQRDISHLTNLNDLLEPMTNIEKLLQTKTKGCCFLAKNPTAQERIQFCQKAQKQFKVDCAGPVLNNHPQIGGRGDQIEKINFIKAYKMIIAFENSQHPGYLTEKALHGLGTRCIPIYWGSENIIKYFNNYIYIKGKNEWDTTIKKIKNILESNEKYLDIAINPPMKRTVLDEFSPERILKLLV